MTQTVQPCSWAFLDDAGKSQTIGKPETTDNMSLLLSVFDRLNILCETLSRLDYVLKRKNMELMEKKHGNNTELTKKIL
jgi:hypothetical protein